VQHSRGGEPRTPIVIDRSLRFIIHTKRYVQHSRGLDMAASHISFLAGRACQSENGLLPHKLQTLTLVFECVVEVEARPTIVIHSSLRLIRHISNGFCNTPGALTWLHPMSFLTGSARQLEVVMLPHKLPPLALGLECVVEVKTTATRCDLQLIETH